MISPNRIASSDSTGCQRKLRRVQEGSRDFAPRRIGLIVPSSNTTMETEIPAMLRRRRDRFTFHSSRVRLHNVTPEELAVMIADSDRCAAELADAEVDAIAYACLVAVMAQGPAFHRRAESRLAAVAAEAGCDAPVVSSAGALVRALQALRARRIAVVAPYLKPLTERVVAYLEAEGIEVVDVHSLEIPRNADVGAHNPARLHELARGLDTTRADAVVLSACVQLPSLPVLAEVERELDLPVLSAATATTFELLVACGLEPVVPEAGHLLSGEVSTATEAGVR
jgi:maleate isomerase